MGTVAAERAARGMPPMLVEIHRVPFLLEPDYLSKPDDFCESHYARMTRKFGSVESFERVKAAHRLMPRAREVGLDADGWSDENLDARRQSSTLRAHRLILWLDATVGWERAERAYARLHTAHFVQHELLNSVDVLLGAAAAAGVDAPTAEAFVRGDELAPTVLRLVDEVHGMGVHSIPSLLVGGELAISGAAGADDVARALRQAGDDALGRRRFAW